MTAIDNIINQIEGETQNRGNTKTRVAAVLRLLRDKIVNLFSNKLDKGTYSGNAGDLYGAIGEKWIKYQGRYYPLMTSRMSYVPSWRDCGMWIYQVYCPREVIQGQLRA